MIFLPVVERELRVAARRRATFWNRSIIGLAATLIAFYVMVAMGRFLGPARAGANLFVTLIYLAFFGCLFAGVFLTADCLSEEKREGTMGLLFLTDLKGYDVVLGKLMATSLSAFYGLLATFPVLALPLLMGGVSFGEFFRTMLALINTLVLSLAIGMLISAVSWKEQKTMLATAGLVFSCGFLLPPLGGPFEWLSPRLALRYAASGTFPAHTTAYFESLLFLLGLSCGLLWMAGRRINGTWQAEEPPPFAERPSGTKVDPTTPTGEQTSIELSPASVRNLGPTREPLWNQNPIDWLASRRHSSGWVWASLALLGFGWLVMGALSGGLLGGGPAALMGIGIYAILALHALLKFWIAWEASRRFNEDRRNGTLDLILTTPLSVSEIMRGHSISLRKLFRAPVIVLLLADLGWLAALMTSNSTTIPTGICLMFLATLGMLVVDAFALGWVGLWLGVKTNKSWVAALGALFRIVALPSAISLLVMTACTASGGSPEFLPFLWGFIGVICSLGFGTNAYSNLHSQFREAVAQGPASRESGSPLPPERPELGQYYSLLKE